MLLFHVINKTGSISLTSSGTNLLTPKKLRSLLIFVIVFDNFVIWHFTRTIRFLAFFSRDCFDIRNLQRDEIPTGKNVPISQFTRNIDTPYRYPIFMKLNQKPSHNLASFRSNCIHLVCLINVKQKILDNNRKIRYKGKRKEREGKSGFSLSNSAPFQCNSYLTKKSSYRCRVVYQRIRVCRAWIGLVREYHGEGQGFTISSRWASIYLRARGTACIRLVVTGATRRVVLARFHLLPPTTGVHDKEIYLQRVIYPQVTSGSYTRTKKVCVTQKCVSVKADATGIDGTGNNGTTKQILIFIFLDFLKDFSTEMLK